MCYFSLKKAYSQHESVLAISAAPNYSFRKSEVIQIRF